MIQESWRRIVSNKSRTDKNRTDKNRTDEVLANMKTQNMLLATLVKQLDTLIKYSAPTSPNYQFALADFKNFDWSSIGAEVLGKDKFGVNGVKWNDRIFIRRSGSGKFGKAIWFSRSIGEKDGKTAYARLVTFKGSGEVEAEPIPFQ